MLDLLYMTGPLWLRLQCFCDIGHLVHDADDKIQEVMFNELPVFATEAKSHVCGCQRVLKQLMSHRHSCTLCTRVPV